MTHRWMGGRAGGVAVVMAAACAAGPVSAATTTFMGTAQSLTDAAAWSEGVPGEADAAVFAVDGETQASLEKGLVVGNLVFQKGKVSFDLGGQTLRVTDTGVVGSSENEAAVGVARGEVRVEGGGEPFVVNAGEVALSGSDAALRIGPAGLRLGVGADAAMHVRDGATLISGDGPKTFTLIGVNEGGDGTLVVSGEGSRLESERFFYVGSFGGTGRVEITDGATASTGFNTKFGVEDGSVGVGVVEQASWHMARELTIGALSGSRGELHVRTGGEVSAEGPVVLGLEPGAAGLLKVVGEGAKLSAQGLTLGGATSEHGGSAEAVVGGGATVELTGNYGHLHIYSDAALHLDGGHITVGRDSEDGRAVEVTSGGRLRLTNGSIWAGTFEFAPGAVLVVDLNENLSQQPIAETTGLTLGPAEGDGAQLQVNIAEGFGPRLNQAFPLIAYRGKLVGRFSGLAEGGVIESGGYTFRVDDEGGVVKLTVVKVP